MIFNYQEEIRKMTNEELLERIYFESAGDDYDGGFTEQGLADFSALQAEFESRLLKIGFLGESK